MNASAAWRWPNNSKPDTVTIGASALSPALFGLIGDAAGIDRALALTATLVLAVLPLTLPLRPVLAARRG